MTKQEAINYINSLADDVDLDVTILTNTISSTEIEKLGISRQLLKYYTDTGKIRTIACGKQKRYILDDIKKLRKYKKSVSTLMKGSN
jgi:hypothetical protein